MKNKNNDGNVMFRKMDETFDHLNKTFDRIEKHFDELSDKIYNNLDKECECASNVKVIVRNEPNIWIQRLMMMLLGFVIGFLLSRFVF